MKQRTNDKMNAKLVAGRDSFGHFNLIDKPKDVLHPDNIELQNKIIELSKKFLFAGTK